MYPVQPAFARWGLISVRQAGHEISAGAGLMPLLPIYVDHSSGYIYQPASRWRVYHIVFLASFFDRRLVIHQFNSAPG